MFILPANFLLAIPLVYGLQQFDSWSLLVPLLFIAIHFPLLRDAQVDSVRAESIEAFEQTPANAILLTDGRDATLFPIWYFRHAEEQRVDLTVVDFNLLAFNWYRDRLQMQNPEMLGLDIDDVERFKQLNQSDRPVCEISLQPFALSCAGG